MTKIFAKLLYESSILLTNFITFGKLFAIQAVLIRVNYMLKEYIELTNNTVDDQLHDLFESVFVNPCYDLLMEQENDLKRKLMIDVINNKKGDLEKLKISYENHNMTIFHDGLKKKIKV